MSDIGDALEAGKNGVRCSSLFEVPSSLDALKSDICLSNDLPSSFT